MTEVHGLTCCWWMPHEGGAYALPSDFAAKLHDSGEIAIYFGDYETASHIVPVAMPAPAPIPAHLVCTAPRGGGAASDKSAPAKRGRRKGVVEFQGAT